MVEANSDDKPRGQLFSAAALAANIFLIAFATDATLSVLDELLHLAAIGFLQPIRNLVAQIVVDAAFIMGIVLIFAPQLPKRVLLPPVLFALWCGFGALPFAIMYPTHVFGAGLAVAQLVLAAIAFALVRTETQNWLLKAEALPHKDRIGWRIAANAATTIVVLVLAGIVLTLTSISALISRETHGYIELGLTSIEAKETTLTKGNSTVRLVGMVHIAEPQFYTSLIDSLPPNGLVLAEGVTDNSKLLTNGLSYNNAARALGLQQQPSLMRAIEQKQAEGAKAAGNTAAAAPKLPTIEDADVDVSSFSPTTIRFLRKVSDLYRGHSFAEVLANFTAIQTQFGPRDITIVMADIIDHRNRHLLGVFDAEVPGHSAIVIPWGAEHMPFMEESLLKRGYRVKSEDVRRVAGYGTIFGALTHRS